jgi:hypothetical protein
MMSLSMNNIRSMIIDALLSPLLFNQYFDTRLPLLANSNYFPLHPIGIFNLQDVTGLIDDRNTCVTSMPRSDPI